MQYFFKINSIILFSNLQINSLIFFIIIFLILFDSISYVNSVLYSNTEFYTVLRFTQRTAGLSGSRVKATVVAAVVPDNLYHRNCIVNSGRKYILYMCQLQFYDIRNTSTVGWTLERWTTVKIRKVHEHFLNLSFIFIHYRDCRFILCLIRNPLLYRRKFVICI